MVDGKAFCSLPLSESTEAWLAGFVAEEQSKMFVLLQETTTDEFSRAVKTFCQSGDDFKSTLPAEMSLMNGNVDSSKAWQNVDAK